jgi:farnesyl diphosphate synthase
VEAQIEALLPLPTGPEARVVEAMRYACLGGGKRLRPFLLCQAAGLFGVAEARSLRAAAALEMVHAYSLVHDDLPSMDDSDLRRGRPTLHKAMDEATAVLAGDALLTEAFAVLCDPLTHEDPSVRCALVQCLAQAAGSAGMVGGQMIDIAAEEGRLALDLAGLERLQALKTGALIACSVEAGALLGGASGEERRRLLRYAGKLGLAFQIRDDILDVESSAEELGKPAGQDAAHDKATFVSFLGLEGAREKAGVLVKEALECLDSFGGKADFLRETAIFVIERRS